MTESHPIKMYLITEGNEDDNSINVKNMELNNLRIIICLKQFESSVKRISIYYVIEKNGLAWHILMLYQWRHGSVSIATESSY